MVIKLIEERVKDKSFIKNWKPISLSNVDCKTTSKVFARFKDVLPNLTDCKIIAKVFAACLKDIFRLFNIFATNCIFIKKVHRRISQAHFRYSCCNRET